MLKAAAAAAVVGTGASVAPARLLARAGESADASKRVSERGLWVGNPRVKCALFAYNEVALLEGPCRAQFEANHKFFLAMDDDALLKPFRVKAGVAAPGADLGGPVHLESGLRSEDGFSRLHSGPQFWAVSFGPLAGVRADGRRRHAREDLTRWVMGFGVAVSGSFYEGYPLPAYTFDKSQCGLIDADGVCGRCGRAGGAAARDGGGAAALAGEGADARGDGGSCRIRTRRACGTRATRCPRIFIWRGSAALAKGIARWRSATRRTPSISRRWRAANCAARAARVQPLECVELGDAGLRD